MSSKFSDQVAQGMSEILKNESFYKPFEKIVVKTASDDSVIDESFNDEDAFDAFANGNSDLTVNAAKKKKEKKDDEDKDDEDKDDKKSDKKDKADKKDKSDKKDKKSKKDADADEEDEDEDDKKSKKSKKSKKDEDENDAMALIFAAKKSKEDKKDGEDKSEKDDKDEDKKDKPKGKKKQFPFWLKKKKAGESHVDDCDCSDCMDCEDEMYASAIRHIVESFTKTSAALENMGLEKSSVATMAILNHIIEEAAYLKFANESVEHVEEKLETLKDKFKKMHHNSTSSGYDDDAAEELDDKITKLEKHLEKLKKEKKDSNDVRGTDLLLGLDDPEAQEGFLDEGMDDPHSSAALEEILNKNPSLVNDIAPRLKSQFGDEALEKQLKERIKSRLPSVIETPENSDISEILKAYHEKIPGDARLPSEDRKTVPFIERRDPLKTRIDELNSNDGMSDDELIALMVKELQHNFKEYDDSGEVNCTKLAENMADKHELFDADSDNDDIPEYVFDCAVEAAEKFEKLKNKDDNDSDDIVQAFNLINEWVKNSDDHAFEDNGDTKVTQDDLKSVLDVLGGYSDDEIKHRELSSNPSDLDAYSKEYYDAAEKI